MSGRTGQKSPKTSAEHQAQVAADLQDLGGGDGSDVVIDTADDVVFENGPRAGQRLSQSEIEKESASEKSASRPDRPTEIIIDGEGATTKSPAKPADDAAAEEIEEVPGIETTDPAAQVTEPGDKPADEKVVDAYQPNTVYKVYDQEKQFPDWAKPLATSKEVEENLRSTLQKSEAFEVLKPKHENVVRERDDARSHVQDHVRRVHRMNDLKDSDLPVFLHSMGVTPKALIDHASQLAYLEKTDPVAYQRELASIESRFNQMNEADSLEEQRAQNTSRGVSLHREAQNLAFSAPDVAEFKARMDATYGAGSFEAAFTNYGSAMWQQSKQYVQPIDACRWVMQRYGTTLPIAEVPPPAVVQPAPAQIQPAPKASDVPKPQAQPRQTQAPRVKVLPSVGRGTAASPVKARPKNFKDLERMIASES